MLPPPSPVVQITKLKFLEQILYLSYYLHQTCIDGAWPYLWTLKTWMLNLGHDFQMLEVKLS